MSDTMARVGLLVTVVGVVGCAGSSGVSDRSWSEALCSRFEYRVPFETRGTERTGDDSIQILEVLGTRPTIEVGGEYVVRGRYRLASFERGRVVLYETENGGPLSRSFDVDLQSLNVDRGSGAFTLLHAMPVDGWLHVDLYGMTGDSPTELCNVYFGSGSSLYPYVSPLRREP